MALAHAIENEVEAVYRRGDPFAKRQLLIAEWANPTFPTGAKI